MLSREDNADVPIIFRELLYEYSWSEVPGSILSLSECACEFGTVYFSKSSYVYSTVYSTLAFWSMAFTDFVYR